MVILLQLLVFLSGLLFLAIGTRRSRAAGESKYQLIWRGRGCGLKVTGLVIMIATLLVPYIF
jgi:hypothetical protein